MTASGAQPPSPSRRRTRAPAPEPAKGAPEAAAGTQRAKRQRAAKTAEAAPVEDVLTDVEPAPGGEGFAVDELPDDRFFNRELSWLDFNARVLTLAADPATPLLERAKFLAIFASNLDEFYMVRVAGLKRRMQTGLPVRSADGLSTREQLELIAERSAELVGRHATPETFTLFDGLSSTRASGT
jgi:polyphosphate kinase